MWRLIRVGMTLLALGAGLTLPLPPAKPAGTATWTVFAGPWLAGTLSVIGFLWLYRRIRPAPAWTVPSWGNSPFSSFHPLQMWHFVSFVALALGFGQVAQAMGLDQPITPSRALPLALGAAGLVGLRGYLLLFGCGLDRRKPDQTP